MKQDFPLENPSHHLTVSGVSYYDANLLDNPLCFFSTKDLDRLNIDSANASGRIVKAKKGLLYVYRFKDPQSGEERVWEIQPDAKRGWCGPFDQDVIALVTNLALGSSGEIHNPIFLPSWREMARLLNRSKSNTNLIRNSVERVAATVIETNAYTLKSEKGKRISATNEERSTQFIFTLWSYFREGKVLPDGSRTDAITLWLNEPFVSALRSFYLRPFDYDYFLDLSPLAKRIYLIQGRKFFGLKRSPYTKEEYQQWCLQLPIVPQVHLSKAKERLDSNAHKELIGTGFLEGVEWIGSQKRPPWEIRYYPGPRAREEVKQGKHRLRRLNAQETHQNAKDGRFSAHDWLAQLSQDLKDTSGKNSGFYFKLGKAVSRGLIRDSLIWSSLSIAKDTMRTHRLKKEMSACFTDELKRSLQQSGKDLKEILSKV
jgi:hypothetical protein